MSECAKQLHVEDWRKYIKIDEKMISRKIKGTLRGDASKDQTGIGVGTRDGLRAAGDRNDNRWRTNSCIKK